MVSPKLPPGGPSGRHFNSNFSYLAASTGADFAVVGSLRGEWTVPHFKSVFSHPVNSVGRLSDLFATTRPA